MKRFRFILRLLLIASVFVLLWTRRSKDHGIGPGPRPAHWLSTPQAEALRERARTEPIKVNWRELSYAQACEDFSRRTGIALEIRYDQLRKEGLNTLPDRLDFSELELHEPGIHGIRDDWENYLKIGGALQYLCASASNGNPFLRLRSWPSDDGLRFIISTEADYTRSNWSLQVYGVSDVLPSQRRQLASKGQSESDAFFVWGLYFDEILASGDEMHVKLIGDRLVVGQTVEGHRRLSGRLDELRKGK